MIRPPFHGDAHRAGRAGDGANRRVEVGAGQVLDLGLGDLFELGARELAHLVEVRRAEPFSSFRPS
jgi:hypothetical protein